MALQPLSRLVRGLTRTRESLSSTLRSVFGSTELDEEAIEDLEATLLAADLGPGLTEEVLEGVRKTSRGVEAREAVRAALRAALPDPEPRRPSQGGPPRVVFVVGVNGGGKTTTVGKLAAREKAAGRKPLMVAADTFRAAAVEQLELWSQRVGVDLIKQREGTDPAAVVFDALRAARARECDTVLVDTAGRLHTKTDLMAELQKLARVAGREIEGAPHEVFLVVDATTGQNGLIQAEQFTRAVTLTGVVLTKLDGTAKGGIALGIHRRIGVGIRYVGVGESTEDLLDFDPDAYVEGLLE
jgi:fused signal recognition particle receptor